MILLRTLYSKKTMDLKSSNLLQPLWSPFNRWFQDTWDRQMPWDLCFPSHPAVPARRPTSLALRQDLRTAVFFPQELRKDEKNDEWRVLILKMCKLSKVIKTMWPTTQSSSIFVFMLQVIRLLGKKNGNLSIPYPRWFPFPTCWIWRTSSRSRQQIGGRIVAGHKP